MKNIESFFAEKYSLSSYDRQEVGIYKHNNTFVTSLCFQQEPEFGEGNDASNISQYPLEDVLDRFFVYITDFYPELNKSETQTCHLEFGSMDIADIRKLRSIIGKHIFSKIHQQNGEGRVELIIE